MSDLTPIIEIPTTKEKRKNEQSNIRKGSNTKGNQGTRN